MEGIINPEKFNDNCIFKNFFQNQISYINHSEKNKVLSYLNLRKDLRGFNPEKGWTHSKSHAADTLTSIAKYDLPFMS